MTGLDVAMLALTLAGFALIGLLPYAAFRLVELAETAAWRARERRRARTVWRARVPAAARTYGDPDRADQSAPVGTRERSVTTR